MSDLEIAREFIRESVVLLRELKDEANLVWVLRRAGDLSLQLGDPYAAEVHWQDAFIIAEKIAHPALATLHKRITQNLQIDSVVA
ncbi:hypothetical protein KFU94_15855 [Chloroflexi bacterium TSY]|nr:hypothetical protein [Chloroflexi bacterium TSY]